MALPQNTFPTYNLTIPSTKKKLKYRPFLVKEEKALLIAQQSEDIVVITDTIKEVITNCSLSPINVTELAIFDIEYIFMQMRAKSVGEYVDYIFACDHDHGEQNKDARVELKIDISQAEVNFPANHTSTIPLFDNVGIKLKYPTLDMVKKLENFDPNNTDQIFDIVLDSIDFIYDGDIIHVAKEQTKEELEAFINGLTPQQFAKIQEFFESMPTLRVWVDYTCPVCQQHHHKYLEGIKTFF